MMDVKQLRDLSIEDLEGRIKTWREEIFYSRFKERTSEARDTSIFKKRRRGIARALTILQEKRRQGTEVAKGV